MLDSKTRSYIFGALRRIWRWSKDRKKALDDSRKGTLLYCSVCKKGFKRERVHVDHKEPVVDPNKGFETWDIYIARLFCDSSNLCILCKACHQRKTNAERKIRNDKKKRSSMPKV